MNIDLTIPEELKDIVTVVNVGGDWRDYPYGNQHLRYPFRVYVIETPSVTAVALGRNVATDDQLSLLFEERYLSQLQQQTGLSLALDTKYHYQVFFCYDKESGEIIASHPRFGNVHLCATLYKYNVENFKLVLGQMTNYIDDGKFQKCVLEYYVRDLMPEDESYFNSIISQYLN